MTEKEIKLWNTWILKKPEYSCIFLLGPDWSVEDEWGEHPEDDDHDGDPSQVGRPEQVQERGLRPRDKGQDSTSSVLAFWQKEQKRYRLQYIREFFPCCHTHLKCSDTQANLAYMCGNKLCFAVVASYFGRKPGNTDHLNVYKNLGFAVVARYFGPMSWKCIICVATS